MTELPSLIYQYTSDRLFLITVLAVIFRSRTRLFVVVHRLKLI